MADDKTALPEANIPAENKASVDPPQHLEKTYSYESSQLEKGNLRKKLGSKGGMDAELAAVLELVRVFLCVKSVLALTTFFPFCFAGDRARRHYRGGEQAASVEDLQARPSHHARYVFLTGQEERDGKSKAAPCFLPSQTLPF